MIQGGRRCASTNRRSGGKEQDDGDGRDQGRKQLRKRRATDRELCKVSMTRETKGRHERVNVKAERDLLGKL